MVITMKYSILLNDEGVSPVIGTVLLLAIGMTVLMTVQLNFVPVWNQQEELNHLEIMNDDFKELKSSIESSAVSGTSLSVPLTMGFKYSPKIIAYNPRDSVQATLSIQKDVWAEVRYNELNPEGMDDAASIKNITSATISYAMQSSHNLSFLIYEHGLIRRSTSNYTPSAQALVTNSSLYLLGVNATEPETTTSTERRVINIYPTSPAKNSVIGKNVWLTLRTKYVDWWADDPNNPSSIQNLGGTIYKKDNASGIIIAYFDRMEIRLGETQVTTRSKKPPERLTPYRLVKITPQNVNLPVVGMNSLVVEVQDSYNNPVPNVQVNFSINTTKKPGNAYSTATLLQNSAISGADGRANIQLKTSGAGLYYIDAGIPAFNTTFTYPASSQAGFISLAYTGAEPSYTITATLRNESGQPSPFQQVSFAAGEGTVTPAPVTTDAITGNASTPLDTGAATGIKLTNIKTSGITNSSANITWDTVNTITVTANRTPGGYIFGNIDVSTSVNSTGCVRYGTSPGNYLYISSCDSNTASHSITLTNLQPYTAYYFIVNSSRPGGASINSSEYMFVTETGVVETIPPASITNPNNVTYLPLYINWTWNDPADADFKEVQVYIDGVYKTTVAKGVRYYNASYFRPNSTHNISTHTVDTNGNVNTTWVNNTANTSTVFTYVFGYDLITGTVTGFDNAKNDSDNGASALFNESLTGGGTPASNNYTNVTNYTATNGTIFNWVNMQSATDGGAFANLTEGGISSGGGTLNYVTNSNFATSNAGWTESNVDPSTFIAQSFDGAVGNTAAGGSGTGSEKFTYIDNINGQPNPVPETAYARINSTSFTAPNGITAISANFAWNSTVANLGFANYKVRYKILNSITLGEVARVYDSGNRTTSNATWTFYQNTTIPASTLTAGNSYIVQVELEIYNSVKTENPSITFRTDDIYLNITTSATTTYSMNITTNTTSVPVDTNYYLQINYSRDANETGYSVYVFNGSAWNLKGNLTSSAWNLSNFTLTGGEVDVITRNVSVRYIDLTPSGSTQGNLSIDYQRVNGSTPAGGGGTYRLNVTTNTTDIPSATNHTLQLRYNVSNDNFTLQLWNGSAWNNRTTLTNSSLSYYNISLLSDELIQYGTLSGQAGSINQYYLLVRYLDLNASAVQQGKLYLDYQRVYST